MLPSPLADMESEITRRSRAAVKLAEVAEALGVLEKLRAELSWRCGRMGGDAANSPRRGERRDNQWRDERRGTASEALIDIEEDTESRWLDQRGRELWNRLRRKRSPKKRRLDGAGRSPER